eukprot:Clim_evm13s147 gene=Clim_evmTU13s147
MKPSRPIAIPSGGNRGSRSTTDQGTSRIDEDEKWVDTPGPSSNEAQRKRDSSAIYSYSPLISSTTSNFSQMQTSTRQSFNTDPSILGTSIQAGAVLPEEETKRPKMASVAEFVKLFDGRRPLSRILIANSSTAAAKAIRSLKQWSYEMFTTEKALQFVVVATPEDIASNSEHLKMADHYVPIASSSGEQKSYANAEVILDIAEHHDVDAVWLGWGHGSEDPKLAEMLHKSGIAFLGPHYHTLAVLGNAITARLVAQGAGIDMLPWSGSSTRVKPNDVVDFLGAYGSTSPSSADPYRLDTDDGISALKTNRADPYWLSRSQYNNCAVSDVESALRQAQELEYPVRVYLAQGPSCLPGVDMVVDNGEALASLYHQIELDYPGSHLFLETYDEAARLIELQMACDHYNNVASIFTRDISAQSRQQTVLGESPAVFRSVRLRHEVEKMACKVLRLARFEGVCSVTFLVSDGKAYFQGVHPALQAEHPANEMISHVNFPALQLQIAMGVPLHRMKELRLLYHADPWGTSQIPFQPSTGDPKAFRKARADGHAIFCRMTLEGPENLSVLPSFAESSPFDLLGTRLTVGNTFDDTDDMSKNYIFVWGENRERARRNLVLALREIGARDGMQGTAEIISSLLESKTFIQNNVTLGWLDETILSLRKNETEEKADPTLALVAAATHLAEKEITMRSHYFGSCMQRGQMASWEYLRMNTTVNLIIENDEPIHHLYPITVTKCAADRMVLGLNDSFIEIQYHMLNDGGMLMIMKETSHVCYIKEQGNCVHVTVDGKVMVINRDIDPSCCRAQMPSKIVRYLVEDGERISVGDPFLEIEAMRMRSTLKAPGSGILRHHRSPGTVVDIGDVLAQIELDEEESHQPETVLTKTTFPLELSLSLREDEKVMNRYKYCRNAIKDIFDGYEYPEAVYQEYIDETLDHLNKCLLDPRLPLLELQTVVGAMGGRIAPSIQKKLNDIIKSYAASLRSVFCTFPVQQIADCIDSYARQIEKKTEHDAFYIVVEPIIQLIQRYRNGLKGHHKIVISSYLTQYLEVEELWSEAQRRRGNLPEVRSSHNRFVTSSTSRSNEDVMALLREKYSENIQTATGIVRAHHQSKWRSLVAIRLLDILTSTDSNNLSPHIKILLERLADLSSKSSTMVGLKARQAILIASSPSFDRRLMDLEMYLKGAMEAFGEEGSSRLEMLVKQSTTLFDVLSHLFYHKDLKLCTVAMEIYLRRAYTAYTLHSVHHLTPEVGYKMVEWAYMLPPSHPFIRDQQKELARLGPKKEKEVHLTSRKERDGHFKGHKRNSSTSSSRGSWSKYGDSDGGRNTAEGDRMFSLTRKRRGCLCAFDTMDEVVVNFNSAVNCFEEMEDYESLDPKLFVNSIVVALRRVKLTNHPEPKNELEKVKLLGDFVRSKKTLLQSRGIRRVTFLVLEHEQMPAYFTFRIWLDYAEDTVYRNIEPALAFQLELSRLSNYNLSFINTSNPRLHLYYGDAKSRKSVSKEGLRDRRLFARCIVRHADLISSNTSVEFFFSEGERMMVEAMDEIELTISRNEFPAVDGNHLFLNFVPSVILDPESILPDLRALIIRHGRRLWKLRILKAEICMSVRDSPDDQEKRVRFFVNNESGYVLEIHVYKEVYDEEKGIIYLESLGRRKGPLHGHSAIEPYHTKGILQSKRFLAQSRGTTYAYDIPELFRQGVRDTWFGYHRNLKVLEKQWGGGGAPPVNTTVTMPMNVLDATEMILDDHQELRETAREHGTNNCSIVVWKLHMNLPYCPQGRDLVIICSDITYELGTFTETEDELYRAAVNYSIEREIPVIYFAANSGARVGLARDVMNSFRVCWNNSQNPAEGIDYLYLTPDDYSQLSSRNQVRAELIEANGENRYKIISIYGKESEQLGAEVLHGSARIAAVMAEAYKKCFTLTIVSCRSIGIGAYLARLGSRVIQVEGSHIILTAAKEQNRMLGRNAYASDAQLGGTHIMEANGVTSLVAQNDYEAVISALRWLSYIPLTSSQMPPVHLELDPVNRPVTFEVPEDDVPYDPRKLIVGDYSGPGSMIPEADRVSGVFDKYSFQEIMSGWAQNVIVGRATLGGIPVAIITVEKRPVEFKLPADPANPDSEVIVSHMSGSILFASSASKMAQAIRDFDKENLPLFIMANWKGFAGGTRDMYDEVLKYSVDIVNALKDYKNPVASYIPPKSDLRGGAWVVVDPAINPEMSSLFADPTSRGGILEPENTIQIKFKERDFDALRRRTADTIAPNAPEHERELGIRQAAVAFADLHDTALRMNEKNAVSALVPWAEARHFFYWHFRRAIIELQIKRRIQRSETPGMDLRQAEVILRRWVVEFRMVEEEPIPMWDDNKMVATWLESRQGRLIARLEEHERDKRVSELVEAVRGQRHTALNIIGQLLSILSAEEVSHLFAEMNAPQQERDNS